MTVQEQSLLIPSYHITVTLGMQFLLLTLQGFVRVVENGRELLPSVRKVLYMYSTSIVPYADINLLVYVAMYVVQSDKNAH